MTTPFVSTVSVLVILLTNFLLGIALYRLPDETYLVEIANNGIRSLIDLSTWLRTTRLGGGFVYCQALGSSAE